MVIILQRKTTSIHEVGELTRIPIKVLPWWGSRRLRAGRFCPICDTRLRTGDWCPQCQRTVRRGDVVLRQVPAHWVCPIGANYSQITWPRVLNGVVILWEGRCGARRYRGHHKHSQTLEVLDIDGAAFLLKITVYTSSHFIIGMDDGHPFVTPVTRRPPTVQDAFDWLVPNKVRESMTLGKDVKRQGDWFFIPTTKEPRLHKFGDSRYNIRCRVPLFYGGSQTRHIGAEVVYQAIQGLPYEAPFVRGDVTAPDHPTLHLESWHIGIRTRRTPGGSADGPGLD